MQLFHEQDRTELGKASRKIIIFLLLTIVPMIVWEIVEIFFLPPNLFTFRQWEAVTVNYVYQGILPGAFYPNQDITMVAAGDQDKNRTPVKKVRFVTDQYGQRNYLQPNSPKTFDFVFIGHSSFGGSHIDQSDTLGEVVKRMCNCETYTYNSGIVRFFIEPRFKEAPPKNIVLELRRGDLFNEEGWNIPELIECGGGEFPAQRVENGQAVSYCEKYHWEQRQIAKLPLEWRIYVDRLAKQLFFNRAKAALGLSSSVKIEGIRPKELEQKFVFGRALQRIKSYNEKAKSIGASLTIFYYPFMHRQWDSIATLLEKEGIKVVGNLPDEHHSWDLADYVHWHHKEDSHWLESSIRETAEKILLLNGIGIKQTNAF